jgi:hypothetical protein
MNVWKKCAYVLIGLIIGHLIADYWLQHKWYYKSGEASVFDFLTKAEMKKL